MADASSPTISGKAFTLDVSQGDGYQTVLGQTLPQVVLQGATWGPEDSDEVILLFHALTASANAAPVADHTAIDGADHWFASLIGPGRALDTNRFRLVCFNTPGSCYGSSGPESIHPATGERIGAAFPQLTLRDMVALIQRGLAKLDITEPLYAAIGGSLGGMLVWQAAVAPELRIRSRRWIPMAALPATPDWFIAFNHAQRLAIETTPTWDRPPSQTPHPGLSLARQLAMLSYRSHVEFNQRFERTRADESSTRPHAGLFNVQSYLNHHGAKLETRFSAASMINLTWAMDLFDVTGEIHDRPKLDGEIHLVSINTDHIFPSSAIDVWAERLKLYGNRVSHQMIQSVTGHDGFLTEPEQVSEILERCFS